MVVIPPRARTLLRQAAQTAAANKRAAAEQLYRQIIREFPQVADGWVGLAEVIGDESEKRRVLEHALTLEPEHREAQQQLYLLDHPEADPPALENENRSPILVEQADAPSSDGGDLPPAPIPFGTLEPMPQAADDEELIFYCATHPSVRTNLRCYSCGKLICSRCSRHTPVGWRCNTCIHEAQEVYFNAETAHYLLAFFASTFIAGIGGFIVPIVGFFTIFLAAGIGSIIGRVAFRLTGRRRGRYLPHTVAAAVVVGGLMPGILAFLLSLLLVTFTGEMSFLSSFNFFWRAVYVALAASAAFYQVR